MASHTYISLFSGVGMLDLAVHIALPGARCVGYCEREGPAASVLATRMGYGELDEAPIYSDVRSFPTGIYRGKVAGIIGGFPCQDLSVAGRQAGINGERSGLFFEIIRLVRDLESVEWIFLENVPPVLAFPAGTTVLGQIAELGFNAEWGTLRASDVGAPHRRDRAFILAYRNGERRGEAGRFQREQNRVPDRGGADLADATRRGLGELRESSWRDGLVDWRGAAVGHAECPERWTDADAGGGSGEGRHRERQATGGAGESGEILADDERARRTEAGVGCDLNAGGEPEAGRRTVGNAASARFERRRSEPGWSVWNNAWRPEPGGRCDGLADAESEGLEERGGGSGRGAERPGPECDSLPLFPPGPDDLDDWRGILSVRPDLAPAVESGVRRVANGAASRVDRLRACGNGVVALQGAAAFIALAQRAGILDGELFTGGHR